MFASRTPLEKREDFGDMEENTTALQRELVIVRRQRKILEEDSTEKPNSTQPEEAYAASIMQRDCSHRKIGSRLF